jgi:excisionase family DNA binding protein
MLSLIAFIAGIVIFIKGGFRLANRAVSKYDARLVGMALMAPFIIELMLVCALSFSMVAEMSDSMVVTEDGSMSLSADILMAYVDQVSQYDTLLLIVLIVALAAAGVIIYRSPQVNPANAPAKAAEPRSGREHPLGASNPFQPAPPKPAAAAPSIMTIAQAAAYLHVTPADIDRMIDEGKLPAARSPGGFRIARSALDDMQSGAL